ncbi:MAG: protein kinase domain-containing protein, partial [Planctomycetota bacterium]
MEYVKGVPLTEHCDLQNLGIEERLGLFLEVCEAVQYAHQKGIIHRDLKPSNILVSVQADKMVPKIIDFGVAKALSQSLTERTLVTEQGQMIGTPEYMSPEQAEMTNQDIDTRSDIYSLGVVLYVLLTGVLPFDPKTLREGGADSIRKVIREEEPKTPSTRLSTLSGENSEEVARHRHVDFSTLQRKLSGDLDWITLKALEKNRMRRYGSVGEFAVDIRHHLKHEPVLARPPSTMYKIKKFIRRNRVTVTAASAVAAALVVGLILSTTLYLQKKHALDTLAKLETSVEVDRHLSTVQKLYAEGRYKAALSEIEAHLQRKDSGPKAQLIHAHLLFDLDRFDEAAAELKKLLTGPAETAGAAHYVLAKIYVGSDPNKSKEHQQLGESLLPQTAEAYSLRGMAAGTPEETLQWLSKAVELEPSHYPSRKARALAYYTLKDYANMAQDVEAMIVMRPKDSLGYALRAMVRRQTGKYNDAIKDHNHAIEICDVKTELAGLYDQRRDTYVRMGNYSAVLRDAQRCVQLEPEEFYYQFHVFTALVTLEEYEAAKEEYKKIVKDERSQEWQFMARVVRHVFDTLGSGQQFELPKDITDEAPFFIMQEAADWYHRLEAKAVRLIPSVFGQSSWSPDGKQMAYGRTDRYEWQPMTLGAGAPTIYGSSGIEILDLESGKTRLLVSSGKDPAWSPDGKYIAFIREPYRIQEYQEEVWLIAASGGEPRRLAVGHWPIWASDSKRLFFHSYDDRALYSIHVDEPIAEPKEIISCPGSYPGVSPDDKYVAYGVGNELRIVEITTGEVITRWTVPGPERGMILRWSPDGKEILVAGFHDSYLGTWSFNVQRKEAWQIFETPAMSANLSADRSKISFELRQPFGEIWLAALDPNIPIYESVTPALTREEYIRNQCQQYIRFVKSGILTEESYPYLVNFINSLSSQAIEQYRNAEYEQALVTLTRIDEIQRALNNNKSRPSDLVYIAMSLHQLGRDKEAQAALDQLRHLFEDDGHTEEEKYLYEAEKLFAGEDNKVYRAWECLEVGKLKETSQLVGELHQMVDEKDIRFAGCIRSVTQALARAYHHRGKRTEHQGGNYTEVIADYESAMRVCPGYAPVFNDLGYLLASCPAAEFRDGVKATENATKACELTNWKDYRYIGTLAAACAEAGDFDSALKWQKKAIDLLPDDKRSLLQTGYESRLKLYQS